MAEVTVSDEQRVRLTEREALANLRTVLQLCAAGQLRCSDKTKRPTAATVRTVTEHLADGDYYDDQEIGPIAAFAWPLLVQAGGLAALEGGKLRLTAKGRAALSKPGAETIRLLWQRWMTHAPMDEFNRIDEIKGQRVTNVLTSAKGRRQVVGQALASCVTDEWLRVDALFKLMRQGNMSPTIARSEMALWRLYLVDQQYGSLGYDGYHNWSLLEGRYTLAVIFEYAATLGLIDLDYDHPDGARTDFHDNWGVDDLPYLSRYDGLESVRLTALGRYVVGLSGTYVETRSVESRVLKVLPSLDVVATGEITAVEETFLSAYAERSGDRVWTISNNGLVAAVAAGRQVEEFVDFLSRRAENELPDVLAVMVNDVGRRNAQLTDLGLVRVVECADAALAALIANDRTLRSLCWQLGDRHVAIKPEDELKFGRALRKLGYVLPN